MAKEPTTKEYKASKEMAAIEGRFEIRNQVARQMRRNVKIDDAIKMRPAKGSKVRKRTGAQ